MSEEIDFFETTFCCLRAFVEGQKYSISHGDYISNHVTESS